MKAVRNLSIMVLILLIIPVLSFGANLNLVSPTLSNLPNGVTVETHMFVDSTTSVITITQETVGGLPDSSYYFQTITTIYPDTNSDDMPEVSVTHTYPPAPPEKDPFDINEDGEVNGLDLWTLFWAMYSRP